MSVAAPHTLAAVLAGGLGRRLGGAKATVPLSGRPLISHPLAAVEAAALEAIVVAKAGSELPPLDVPVVTEPAEPRHPLCGIIAALDHAGERGVKAVVVLACDMPLVPPQLLAWLAEFEQPLVVPMTGRRPQPLCARYSTTLLPALREALHSQPGPLTEIVRGLRPHLLSESELARFGDPSRLFHNVNTVAELRLAARLLRGASS